MRRRDKEETDRAAVLDVLARGEVVRLAMIAPEGGPYLVPLSYAALPPADGEPLRLVVHGAPDGRKIDALRKDPRVCFEVTVDAALVPAVRACEVSVRFRSVIGFGRAAFLTDAAARARALAALAERYAPGAPPIDEGEARKIAIVEIRVESATCKVSPPPRPRGA